MFAAQNFWLTNQQRVLLDSVGSGYSGFTSSATWTHVIAPSAKAVVLGINFNSSGLLGNVTCGGVTMTASVSTIYTGGFANEIWILTNPPSGTVTFTVAVNSGGYVAANSASFFGVSSIGIGGNPNTAFSVNNSSTGVSLPSQQPLGAWFVSLATNWGGGSFSIYRPGTTLWNESYLGGHNYPLLLGLTPANVFAINWSSPGGTVNASGVLLSP